MTSTEIKIKLAEAYLLRDDLQQKAAELQAIVSRNEGEIFRLKFELSSAIQAENKKPEETEKTEGEGS
jgi:hypothetical protein